MKASKKINRPRRCSVDPETEERRRSEELLVERELIRVALRMIMNHEPDEKITQYTSLVPEKISWIRETMFEQYYLEQRRKGEMIQKSLLLQDPQM